MRQKYQKLISILLGKIPPPALVKNDNFEIFGEQNTFIRVFGIGQSCLYFYLERIFHPALQW